MKFLQIINDKKISLIAISLFLYVILNLFDGERGLISYYEKQKLKKQLFDDQKTLTSKLKSIEKENNMLTENIDLDYLEILYRIKFMHGKSNEKIYKVSE